MSINFVTPCSVPLDSDSESGCSLRGRTEQLRAASLPRLTPPCGGDIDDTVEGPCKAQAADAGAASSAAVRIGGEAAIATAHDTDVQQGSVFRTPLSDAPVAWRALRFLATGAKQRSGASAVTHSARRLIGDATRTQSRNSSRCASAASSPATSPRRYASAIGAQLLQAAAHCKVDVPVSGDSESRADSASQAAVVAAALEYVEVNVSPRGGSPSGRRYVDGSLVWPSLTAPASHGTASASGGAADCVEQLAVQVPAVRGGGTSIGSETASWTSPAPFVESSLTAAVSSESWSAVSNGEAATLADGADSSEVLHHRHHDDDTEEDRLEAAVASISCLATTSLALLMIGFLVIAGLAVAAALGGRVIPALEGMSTAAIAACAGAAVFLAAAAAVAMLIFRSHRASGRAGQGEGDSEGSTGTPSPSRSPARLRMRNCRALFRWRCATQPVQPVPVHVTARRELRGDMSPPPTQQAEPSPVIDSSLSGAILQQHDQKNPSRTADSDPGPGTVIVIVQSPLHNAAQPASELAELRKLKEGTQAGSSPSLDGRQRDGDGAVTVAVTSPLAVIVCSPPAAARASAVQAERPGAVTAVTVRNPVWVTVDSAPPPLLPPRPQTEATLCTASSDSDQALPAMPDCESASQTVARRTPKASSPGRAAADWQSDESQSAHAHVRVANPLRAISSLPQPAAAAALTASHRDGLPPPERARLVLEQALMQATLRRALVLRSAAPPTLPARATAAASATTTATATASPHPSQREAPTVSDLRRDDSAFRFDAVQESEAPSTFRSFKVKLDRQRPDSESAGPGARASVTASVSVRQRSHSESESHPSFHYPLAAVGLGIRSRLSESLGRHRDGVDSHVQRAVLAIEQRTRPELGLGLGLGLPAEQLRVRVQPNGGLGAASISGNAPSASAVPHAGSGAVISESPLWLSGAVTQQRYGRVQSARVEPRRSVRAVSQPLLNPLHPLRHTLRATSAVTVTRSAACANVASARLVDRHGFRPAVATAADSSEAAGAGCSSSVLRVAPTASRPGAVTERPRSRASTDIDSESEPTLLAVIKSSGGCATAGTGTGTAIMTISESESESESATRWAARGPASEATATASPVQRSFPPLQARR